MDERCICSESTNLYASSACYGDSGSPLIVKDGPTQIGIASWGMMPCGAGPIVYARVSAYIDFIEEHVNQLTVAITLNNEHSHVKRTYADILSDFVSNFFYYNHKKNPGVP